MRKLILFNVKGREEYPSTILKWKEGKTFLYRAMIGFFL